MINDKLLPIIVENGTKNKGTYVKFKDGTMICYGGDTDTVNITSSAGGIYYTTYSFSFPKDFISAPAVIPSITQTSGLFWAGLGNKSTQTKSGTQLRVMSGTSASNVSVTFGYIAIGKWK